MLPVSDIVSTFADIELDAPNDMKCNFFSWVSRDSLPLRKNCLIVYVQYVKRTYVIGANNADPRYKPQDWCVSGRTISQRTSCAAESFHSVLNVRLLTENYKKTEWLWNKSELLQKKLLGGDGQKACRLMSALREEEQRVTTGLRGMIIDPTFKIGLPPCARSKRRTIKIENAMANPSNLTGLAFLDYIASYVGKYRD